MSTTFTRGWSLEARLFFGSNCPASLCDCWVWQGRREKGGYGRINDGRKTLLVHRASHTIYIGPIPAGLQVLHRCDNPPCWNPFHIWAGNQQENMDDCIAKGRHARGERIHLSKLNDANIPLIRSDPRSTTVLGLLYGVDPSVISRVKNRLIWKHVP